MNIIFLHYLKGFYQIKKYIKFREIIEDIKANKKNQKRDLKDSESGKELFTALDKIAKGKKKIKYPKK